VSTATLSFTNILAVVVGALVGTAVTLRCPKRNGEQPPSRLSAPMMAICAAAGALTGLTTSWPEVASSLVFGVLSAAGPMTLVLSPAPAIRSAGDAADYLRRAALAVAVNIGCGVGFATVGFIIAWGASHLLTDAV
jgi:uncharacterized membrane protein YfcA